MHGAPGAHGARGRRSTPRHAPGRRGGGRHDRQAVGLRRGGSVPTRSARRPGAGRCRWRCRRAGRRPPAGRPRRGPATESSHAPIRRAAAWAAPLGERLPAFTRPRGTAVHRPARCPPPTPDSPGSPAPARRVRRGRPRGRSQRRPPSAFARRTARPSRTTAPPRSRARPGAAPPVDPDGRCGAGRRPPDPPAPQQRRRLPIRRRAGISPRHIVRFGNEHDPAVRVNHDLVAVEPIVIGLRALRHLRQQRHADLEDLRGCESGQPDQTGQRHTAHPESRRRTIGRQPLDPSRPAAAVHRLAAVLARSLGR